MGKYICIKLKCEEKLQKRRTSTTQMRIEVLVWSEWRDLNSRPLDPQSSALPTAPHPDVAHCNVDNNTTDRNKMQ